jgi:Tfp pilus assembly protein PilF
MAEQYATMDAEIKINLAIAYYQGKQVQLAKQKFQEAQKIDPDVAEENQYLRSILFD